MPHPRRPTPEEGLYGRPRPPIRSHGRRRRFPLGAILVAILGLATLVVGLRYVPGSPLAASPGHATSPQASASPSPTPEPLPFRSAEVNVTLVATVGFLSWALLDRRTGEIIGSDNLTATSTTASMIKAWLVADYLRLAGAKGRTPTATQMHDAEITIRDSDNDAGERIYAAVGRDDSIRRLISLCRLTDTKLSHNFWSKTTISARDTVRMGECLADGRAAGPQWTPWLLDMMRKVRGEGDAGIRKALPAEQQPSIAIKNGWLLRDEDHNWHTNCLAIGDTWVLGVLERYPTTGHYNTDEAHTFKVCEDVARLLLNPTNAPPASN